MALLLSDVDICANCRISAGHHIYIDSAGAAEGYFRGKSILHFDTVAVVRTEPSKHGYNAGCIHLPVALSALTTADYVVFKNSTDSVAFIGKVESVEYVNPTSSRVYFKLDYYATYCGYIHFGNCYILRQHPKEDPLGGNMQAEPIELPMVSTDCAFADLEGSVETLWKSAKFHVLAPCDELGNGNSAKVQAHIMLGTPSFGYYQVFSSEADLGQWITKFYNNGITSTQYNQVPHMSVIQRVWFAPEHCGDEDPNPVPIAIPFSDPNPPSYKWAKMFAPQFYRFKITAQSTGQNMELTLFNQNTVNPQSLEVNKQLNIKGKSLHDAKALYWDLYLYVSGLPYPQMGLGLYYFGNTMRPSPDELIMQAEFPQVPISAMYDINRRTLLGVAYDYASETGAGLQGAIDMVGGVGAAITGDESGAARSIANGINGLGAYAGGMIATGANVLGYGNKVWKGRSVNGTPEAGMASGYFHYQFNTTRYAPTDEGVQLLTMFFNRYGYAQNKFMELNLKIRGNFTYTQIGQGATFTSDTAPQIAIDAIRNMLENGLTVWVAPIGSTADCG